MTYVKPIATDTSCWATPKPSEYCCAEPFLESAAKLTVNIEQRDTHLNRPFSERPDGSWKRIPTTMTGKLAPLEKKRP